jgi:hypothetical protein
MQRVGAVLWPHFPCVQIYGANTNVGKTIVSTLLCHAWSKKRTTYYLKPVSTGSLEEADNRYVLSLSLFKHRCQDRHFSSLVINMTLSSCGNQICRRECAGTSNWLDHLSFHSHRRSM